MQLIFWGVKMSKYYSLDKILKNDCQFYMIVGKRSKGKSYAVDKYAIDNYFKTGEKFIVIKRYADDITSSSIGTMLNSLEPYIIDTYGKKVSYYNHTFYLYDAELESRPSIKDCEVLAKTLAINQCDRIKGSQYPDYTTIIFEEFIASTIFAYLPKELTLFLNVISTIVRDRSNVKIFLLGNTITKHNIYTEALGIDIYKMRQGQIITKKFTDNMGRICSIAVERTEDAVEDINETRGKVSYALFGENETSGMIEDGGFVTEKFKNCIGNVCLKKPKGKNKMHVLGKNDFTGILLTYLDYMYKVYLYRDEQNYIVGVRRVNEVGKDVNIVLNTNQYFSDKMIVNNVKNCKNELVRDKLLKIFDAVNQGLFIAESNDDGQNAKNGFMQIIRRSEL